ncbi:choline sulfatase [Pseudalgibacter alginicilyticus]|uniref:Choline sulfatase n=1 Tax=Pseudalgibacter alginicilyticus TaxID=1736674 RepID=A0A0P0D0J9_9FLAO|nr:sulfatase-like hydrolase/transferase [Pseudalgibacter alginicilyticus]ALJ06465.1 choline sulfatase [Pseudalgibacter alginicilyticus]
MAKLILRVLILTSIFYNTKGYAQHTNSEKPNILFIFTDDQRADAIGASGNTYIKTPNIDKLAQAGTLFENAYVMGGNHGAVCAASRAMLLSGKSLFHVYDKLKGSVTMPSFFNQHGYESFATGKWHNEEFVFEESFDKGKNVMAMGMSNHFSVPMRDLDANKKLTVPVEKGFSTDLFADATIEYLNNYTKENTKKPFFCYVAFSAPHDPRSPREDYVGMYKDDALPFPGNFKPWHPFKFDNMNIRDETLGPWPRTSELISASLADYYALISHMDARIGDIIQTLKDQKLYDNTIIVFASDNGLAIGSHGLLGKQNLYEHSIKVPLIMSGPGITKNQKSNALLYLYDIFPTLADLCGIPQPKNIDGENFAAILKGENAKTRKSLYSAYRNTVRAVRTNEWKLITYPNQNYQQLFNLKNDPLELNNLAENPVNKAKVDELSKLMALWYLKSDDTANMSPDKILPMEYDYKKLKQNPDDKQPQYILDKYFKEVDFNNIRKTKHD